jgi:hypothetical protein
MSQRDEDLRMLNDLLEEHAASLTEWETEAFADMRFSLTAYVGNAVHRFEQLTDKQREKVKNVYERLVPQYANLASSGGLARGTPTAESRSLDAMLARPIPARPRR